MKKQPKITLNVTIKATGKVILVATFNAAGDAFLAAKLFNDSLADKTELEYTISKTN
jgi:hypothetical protein